MNINPTIKLEEAPMQPAPKLARIIAFLLDIILIMVFTFTVLFVFVIPQKYATPMQEFQKIVVSYTQKEKVTEEEILKDLTEEMVEMIHFIQIFVISCFWGYFTLIEYFTGGSSLGKKAFSLQVMNANTLKPPSFFDTLLRSGLKTLSIFAYFPYLVINYFFIFGTRDSRAGHDLLCRTVVIQSNKNSPLIS